MSIKPRNNLKNTFINGYIPTQNDFADVFDSYIHQQDDELMISTGGNIGIGTSTPSEKLHVVGNVQVDGDIYANNIIIPGMGMVPTGGIIMWSGGMANFDNSGKGMINTSLDGWALCNGLNGTPDLRGRFIVGLSNADPNNYGYNNIEKNRQDYDTSGKNGGFIEVKLNDSQCALPSHDHLIYDPGHDHAYDDQYTPETGTGYTSGSNRAINWEANLSKITQPRKTGILINPSGKPLADDFHENRPPYYVLAFIMKV